MASFVQRLITRLMPRRAAEIERQSREWDVACPNCGETRSVWDIGGVRYKASSAGKRIGATCPSCGDRGLFEVVRHVADDRAGG